ncbi:DUF2163 domain-containing protein [Roseibium suaedae]|uniref:Bacteriophage phiJL001 Gp84 C-terminal domain-containing protein n=1 Tax=Roseibium suaedae TaxID=735517 RepID=A0A1M7CCP7_9HYPH|nr:DUF2163 domain-containing protein [Roseibium suaedae]SHL64960.1 phage conserved hypothetical protein BR0599 [Roseibium suaedae]
MKTIPTDLAARLLRRETTLALCWVVTRTDGVQCGFTDHDRPVSVSGVTCLPENGLEASARTSGPGFAAAAGDVAGALSGPALSEDELEAGLWDGAEVSVHLVDWSAGGSVSMALRRARIGEVSRKGAAFQAELRGLAHVLEARYGRVYSRSCDADLGDARCGVDLEDPDYTTVAVVVSATAAGDVQLVGAGTYEEGWFTGGLLKVLDGERQGFASEIANHTLTSTGALISLWQAPPTALAAGIEVLISAGCDKRFATCRAKFANGLNFQGFPHLPGTDFVLSYPTRNTGTNDGGPRVS